MPAATVTVACKHPQGIFMRVHKMEEYSVPLLGGGSRTEKRAIAVAEHKIHGPNVPPGRQPKCLIIGGYALTPNVPAETAAKWMDENKDSALVKNKIVMIHEKRDAIEGMAKDGKDVRAGTEPLDTSVVYKNNKPTQKDPRWPTKINPNMSGIETQVEEDF